MQPYQKKKKKTPKNKKTKQIKIKTLKRQLHKQVNMNVQRTSCHK